MLYRCTAFSASDDWSYGRNEYLFNANGISYFELQFASDAWLNTLQIGGGGTWSLIMRGNLTVRKDTGRINSSPVVTMPPIVKAPSGCVSQIRLDVRDPDGDIIRCRWATSFRSECGGVCNAFPNSTLNSDTCILTYYGGNSTGQFVVAIQVEDFARSEDIIPLSSVPLQFVVKVVSPSNASIPCGYLPPVFIPPTPLNGTCIPILWGQRWNATLLAQIQSNLTRISVTGATPYVVLKNDTHISAGIAWNATDDNSTRQVICYNATDSLGTSSGTRCFTLLVMKGAGIKVTIHSDNLVQINWTHTKPSEQGFNISLYTISSNSTILVKSMQLGGCALSTQLNGIDGGTPYQVVIAGLNEHSVAVEIIISSVFFTSQKVPSVAPYGIVYILLPNNVIMVEWSQPTLIEARGFVIGYTLVYSCYKNSTIDRKVYDISTNMKYLQAENDSRVTCSISVCAKTIAGCGPPSQPLIIQDETECQKAPKITVQPESIFTTMGSPVTLECHTSGCPIPKITWFKDNAIVSNDPYLVIQAVTLSDRGFYACKAENNYGYAFSSEAKLSLKGVYQYSAYLQLNISATLNIVDELSRYLTGRSVVNNSANILFANISYSGTTIKALITLAGNNTLPYNTIVSEIYFLISTALEYKFISTINVQRFDGCPLISICDDRYVWRETELGSIYTLSPCIYRRCGGTYSTGGQWEDVILTCNTDYVSCAVSELEDLVEEALNNTKIANRLLSGVDNLINTNNYAAYQSQDAQRLLNLLNYYSNNAIINETTVFTGKVFAIQLEDISISKGCFTGRNFSINLGYVDMAAIGNTTIDIHAIGSSSMENTTASVTVLPIVSINCSNTGSSHRLTFYTFLKNTLFPSAQQEKENFKLGSIIISVGGSAVTLAEKLQFSFQVAKDTISAYPVQWTTKYINDSYEVGMWSTEGSRVLSRQNSVFRTETLLKEKVNTRQRTVYQGNFGMLLDLNPGMMSCPAAEILSTIGTIISVISLLFFVITYLSSKNLRRSEHGQVLINMSCALLCLYVVFLVAGYTTSVPAMCGFSAALVHYFMLVYFMWTLVEAVFLYMKLVKVLGSKVSRFSLKAGLVSWLVPLGIVVISAGAGYRYYYNHNYCRATGFPFYLGFILPFLIIYVFNWIFFIVIMVSIWKHSARSAVKESNEAGGKSFTMRNVVIAAGLALVLGLGWGFGLAASSHNISALACAFQFVFSLFVSCQGLLLLIFHGVRSKDAKVVWKSWFSFHKKLYSVGTSTIVDGTAVHRATSTPQPTISIDEKLYSKSEDSHAIEEKMGVDTSNGKGISSGPDNAVVEMEKGVPQKTARGVVSFFKKPTPRIILPYSKMDNQSTSPS